MDKRLLLDKIDYEEGSIMIEGKKYELLDKSFLLLTRIIHMNFPKQKKP